ncbi:hypothetical protein HYS29_00420 [Candidatus Microgenomates bacterium]|nr:hypothetical protein [Candidatus Microgenomates bacterium]
MNIRSNKVENNILAADFFSSPLINVGLAINSVDSQNMFGININPSISMGIPVQNIIAPFAAQTNVINGIHLDQNNTSLFSEAISANHLQGSGLATASANATTNPIFGNHIKSDFITLSESQKVSSQQRTEGDFSTPINLYTETVSQKTANNLFLWGSLFLLYFTFSLTNSFSCDFRHVDIKEIVLIGSLITITCKMAFSFHFNFNIPIIINNIKQTVCCSKEEIIKGDDHDVEDFEKEVRRLIK